jgi:hypothetical protein
MVPKPVGHTLQLDCLPHRHSFIQPASHLYLEEVLVHAQTLVRWLGGT